MIYILSGTDTKNKNLYIKELTGESEVFFIQSGNFDKDLIIGYSTNVSLFGNVPVIVMDNILTEELSSFSREDMILLKESKTIFIFKEDKLTVADQKKHKKYGDIRNFEGKKEALVQKFNIFSLTDAFANRDKIKAWTLYIEAISSGIEAEAISGVLFWKIKTMILSGSRMFSKEELKKQSSFIVSIYHKAHKGEVDFNVSLEQFILASLSSK